MFRQRNKRIAPADRTIVLRSVCTGKKLASDFRYIPYPAAPDDPRKTSAAADHFGGIPDRQEHTHPFAYPFHGPDTEIAEEEYGTVLSFGARRNERSGIESGGTSSRQYGDDRL